MNSIYNYTLNELKAYLLANNEKPFKASQIYEWLYKRRITNFDDMSNIKKETIEKLKNDFNFDELEIIEKLKSKDVCKYLFKLNDGAKIEAVLMKHDYGNSLCVSSQVGCNMSCTFCESGRLKKVRNLEPFEMVSQILQIEADLKLRISHIVLMGIGEPFDNYDNIIKFIDIINEGKGIDIGARHITVSTCGIIPKINEFKENPKQVNLAISLHASNDELRSKIMPINKVYKLQDLIKCVKEYYDKTKRRITFEYIMLDGVNDSEKNAVELADLLKGLNCYVNLIPYNETTHIEYKKSNQEKINKFYDTLKKHNINVTVRREFGSEVMAACGQLRSHYEECE